MHQPIPRNPLSFIVGKFPTRCLLTGAIMLLALLPLRVPAMTVIPPSFDELVNKSDYIVRAVVKSVTSERRDSNGKSLIYTFAELDVREVIAGTPPSPLVLRMLGGQVGDEVLEVGGAPKFVVGQEDILFVRGNGRQFYPLTAVMHGRYRILKDAATQRTYVARSNRAPLTKTEDVAQPMDNQAAGEEHAPTATIQQALSPEAFIKSIRSAVNPNHRPARAK